MCDVKTYMKHRFIYEFIYGAYMSRFSWGCLKRKRKRKGKRKGKGKEEKEKEKKKKKKRKR